jgi:vitamin B12 transporter
MKCTCLKRAIHHVSVPENGVELALDHEVRPQPCFPGNQMRATAAAAILMLGALPASVLAEPTSTPSPSAVPDRAAVQAENETIVVSATRAPLKRSQVGSSLTSLDKAQLERLQTITLVDVLRDVPGVGVSRNGGAGGLSTVRIRGAEGDQTIVLIDGVKLNDPSSPGGGYDFANLLTANIEQVEVLRGPQSTLYGSQAIGGVVSITTRQGAGPLRLGFDGEVGEDATYGARLNASAGSDRLSWAVAGAHFQSDGISAFDSRLGGKEVDPYQNTGAVSRLVIGLSEAVALDMRASLSHGEVAIDGFAPPSFALGDTPDRSTTDELTLYAGLTLKGLDNRLQGRLGASRARIDRLAENPLSSPTTTFSSVGQTDRLDGQLTLDVTPTVQIISGFEVEESAFSTKSPSSFDPDPAADEASATVHAVYVQGQVKPSAGLTATLGVRRSQNDRFGQAINARATLAWAVNEGNTIFRASLGDGFKAPTLFQTFSDYGNESLKPETGNAWDAGVEQAFLNRRLVIGATYFERDTTNQIDFISCFNASVSICAGRPFGTYDNIAKASAEGLEATLEARILGGWRLAGAYTDLQTANRTPGPNLGKALPRRAEHSGSLTLSHSWTAGHDVSVSVTDVGSSFDNAANTRRLKGYTLVTVRAQVRVNSTITLFGRIENAANEHYQTASGYGSAGRQAFIGLRTRL